MPYEYVSNTRHVVGGERLTLRKTDDGYELHIVDWAHGGSRHRTVKLSQDDIKALYIMLDDIVGTF